MGARVVAREETAPLLITMFKIPKKNFSVIFIGAQSARNRARPCSAHQWTLLIKEILFDCSIVSVAQKLDDLAQIEVNAKIFQNGGVTNDSA